MSPTAALESDVFRIFAVLTAGMLLSGGAIIAILRYRFHKDVSYAWRSYRGWLFMVPAISLSLFMGRISAIIFLALVAAVAFTEYARATGIHRRFSMIYICIAGMSGMLIAAIVRDPFTGAQGWYQLFVIFPVLVIPALFLTSILKNDPDGQLRPVALSVFGFTFIAWMFGHVMFLANSRNAYGYLLYLLFAVEFNDIAAFTCGKIFGRRPLCTNVSPWKTREGAMGAVLVSALFPLAVRFALPEFSTIECVFAGLLVGVSGHLGDLSVSLIKRDIGIKDMGSLIPGHGGVLDRIDSLLYAGPLFFYFTRFTHGI